MSEKYPVFIQKWFPGIGATNLIGEWKDKSMLRWILEQTMSWNNIQIPAEGFYFRSSAYDETYTLLGWMTLESKEEFGRSYQEIRAVLIDDTVTMPREQIRELLFQLNVTEETKPCELVLSFENDTKKESQTEQKSSQPVESDAIAEPETKESIEPPKIAQQCNDLPIDENNADEPVEENNLFHKIITNKKYVTLLIAFLLAIVLLQFMIIYSFSSKKSENIEPKQEVTEEQNTPAPENTEEAPVEEVEQPNESENIEKVEPVEPIQKVSPTECNIKFTISADIEPAIIIGSTLIEPNQSYTFPLGNYKILIDLKKDNLYFTRIAINNDAIAKNCMQSIFEREITLKEDATIDITVDILHKISPPEAGYIKWNPQGEVEAIANPRWVFHHWENFTNKNPRQLVGREKLIIATFKRKETILNINAPQNVFQIIKLDGKNINSLNNIVLEPNTTHKIILTWDSMQWHWRQPENMFGKQAEWHSTNKSLEGTFSLPDDEEWTFDFDLLIDCQVHIKNTGNIIYNNQRLDGITVLPFNAVLSAKPENNHYMFVGWHLFYDNVEEKISQENFTITRPYKKIEAYFQERSEYNNYQEWSYKKLQKKRNAEAFEEWLADWPKYEEFMREDERQAFKQYEEKMYSYNTQKNIVLQDFQEQHQYSPEIWNRWQQNYKDICNITTTINFKSELNNSKLQELERIKNISIKKSSNQCFIFSMPLANFFDIFHNESNPIIKLDESITLDLKKYTIKIGGLFGSTYEIQSLTFQLTTGKEEILNNIWSNCMQ